MRLYLNNALFNTMSDSWLTAWNETTVALNHPISLWCVCSICIYGMRASDTINQNVATTLHFALFSDFKPNSMMLVVLHIHKQNLSIVWSHSQTVALLLILFTHRHAHTHTRREGDRSLRQFKLRENENELNAMCKSGTICTIAKNKREKDVGAYSFGVILIISWRWELWEWTRTWYSMFFLYLISPTSPEYK